MSIVQTLNDSCSAGAAVLVDDPSAHKNPSPSQLQKWNEEQKESARSQIAAVEAKSSSGSSKANSEEAQRKRREREERRRAQQAALQAAEDSLHAPSTPSTTPAEPTSIPTPSLAQGSKDPSGSSIPYSIVVPAPSSQLEWYDPSSSSYSTIEAARDAGIWTYPSNLQERARCGVFRGLWDQGFYMGVGIRFGGEYLVYPGLSKFPLRFASVRILKPSHSALPRRPTAIPFPLRRYSP